MSKEYSDLTNNQQTVLKVLEQTKEVHQVIGESKVGTYAKVSESDIFKGLMDLEILKITKIKKIGIK